jgi:hypothetical protein
MTYDRTPENGVIFQNPRAVLLTHVGGGWKETQKMDKRAWLDREIFLRIAQEAGLNPEDPHLEELYAYVRDVLPGLKVIEELDLKDVEPMSSPEVQESSQ